MKRNEEYVQLSEIGVAGILLDTPVVHSFLRFADASRHQCLDVDGRTARSLHARVDMSLQFHLFRSRTHSHHFNEHSAQPGRRQIHYSSKKEESLPFLFFLFFSIYCSANFLFVFFSFKSALIVLHSFIEIIKYRFITT